jgi:hypothetical protein
MKRRTSDMGKTGKSGPSGVHRRVFQVSDKAWARWTEAAAIAGISRADFVICVCNHAAHQILEEYNQRKEGWSHGRQDAQVDDVLRNHGVGGEGQREPDAKDGAV